MRITKETVVVAGTLLFFVFVITLIPLCCYWAINLLGETYELKNHVEIPSPDKRVIVDICDFYGGATSTDGTLVFIRERGETFDIHRNFCLFSTDGLKKTKVAWVNETEIEIQYEPGVIDKAARGWNGISVIYSELK